jgi:hypothetical protein
VPVPDRRVGRWEARYVERHDVDDLIVEYRQPATWRFKLVAGELVPLDQLFQRAHSPPTEDTYVAAVAPSIQGFDLVGDKARRDGGTQSLDALVIQAGPKRRPPGRPRTGHDVLEPAKRAINPHGDVHLRTHLRRPLHTQATQPLSAAETSQVCMTGLARAVFG